MQTERREIIAPTPEVHHLPTIFRKIENGEVRIPAFQRRFVWTEAQVLKLLESVYHGYPIGSTLLWRVDEELLRVSQDTSIPFPQTPARYPLSFVLDGMQRLSTLYGVVYWSKPDEKHVFNVVFDLESRSFRHYSPDALPTAYIPLSALSSPKRLLDAQRSLAEQQNGDELIDRTVELQAVFQEYMIPTVTITRRDVAEVVEIFERINNTGTRLSTVDFMRALTWSSAFDLSERIENLHGSLTKQGFEFDAETLVKVVAVILGIAPTPHDMLALRMRDAGELSIAVERAQEVLSKCIRFLKARFRILSSDFVPYEGQLLVLAKVFATADTPPDYALKVIEQWLWSISFSEGLRGKPDHYVTRALRNAEQVVTGEANEMDYRLDITPEQFLERRLIKGAALSAGVASLWATRGARSLRSGEIIPAEYYMSEFTAENFLALLDVDSVRSAIGRSIPSARVFANTVLVTEAERTDMRNVSALDIIDDLHQRLGSRAEAVLESQLLPPDSLRLLREKQYLEFLSERAARMYIAAREVSRDAL